MRSSDWSSDVCSSDLVVGNMGADVGEPPIDLRLDADRGFLDPVARPAGDRIVALQPDVERSADIALGRRGKTRKFLDLCNRPIACCQPGPRRHGHAPASRSDEHTPELQSPMRISYTVFFL